MDYSNTPISELENLLRRRDISPAQQQSIKAELAKRYEEQLLGPPDPAPPASSTASAPPPPAPPPTRRPSTTGPQPPRQSAEPPSSNPPPIQPAKRSETNRAGWLIALVVLAAIAVLYFVSQDAQSPAVPPVQTGTMCVVPYNGSCPLATALPVGVACTCTDGYTVYSGIVQ